MSDVKNVPVRFSTGTKNFGKVKNLALPWQAFTGRFKEPIRTGERYRDYVKMSEKQQRDLKAINGYWMRAQNEGGIRKRGNALDSDLITLDIDYATPEMFESALKGEMVPGVAHMIHTSRRHTEDNPRFRIVILNAEPLPNDYYPAVSRIVCAEIDKERDKADPVSFRPAQMMFMPTVCKDGDYHFEVFEGEPLDWRSYLDVFEETTGDWRDVTTLPKWAGESNLRNTADKAEDPTTKDGPVGDFCRAYSIPEAIEEFLPDIYAPVDMPSAKPRYTYMGGTTVNGAEVQDDGLFLYSHHGSDPVSDMLVNSFDLVRLHLFGKKDEDTDPDETTPGKMPSWAAMLEFIDKDEEYRKSRLQSRYDTEAMFDDLWDEDKIEIEEATSRAEQDNQSEEDRLIAELVGEAPTSGYSEDDVEADYPDIEEEQNPPSAKPAAVGVDNQAGHIGISSDGYPYLKSPRRRAPKPDKKWVEELEIMPNGNIANSLPNLAMILRNDTRFRDAIAHNEFTQNNVMIIPIRHKVPFIENHVLLPEDEIMGEDWGSQHASTLRTILEMENGPGKSGWGLTVADRNLDAALDVVATQHKIHPIKEILKSFEHDGTARVERLFIDYLGVEDNAYHREIAKLFMVAAVTRVFEPGHKFDFAPVLVGGQGARKSSFAEALAMGFFGELTADFSEDQKLVEQMKGNWIMELPELVSMTRSEVEPAKAFLSARRTRVRLAYERHAATYKRQCVFIGTTNNIDFLKDDTGNRRFWPVHVEVPLIDTDLLKRNLAQLWAEAYAMYVQMRKENPTGPLPLYLQGKEAALFAADLQERSLRVSDADVIAEQLASYLESKHADDEFDGVADGGVPQKKRREYTSVGAILSDLPELPRKTQFIASALVKLGWEKTGTKKRISGVPNPVSVYVPGPEVLARWEEEDSPDDDLI
jgi:putative DNA primase/helicase